MNTSRLKVFHRDFSDWRYQVLGANGDVLAERRFLPDRASAERIGERERLRIAAELARTAAATQWLERSPVLKQDELAGENVRARSWIAVFFGRTRLQKPWKTVNAERSFRPLRVR